MTVRMTLLDLKRRKDLLIFIFFLLLSSCAAPIWQSVDLARRQGDLVQAEKVLVTHVQENPNDAKAWFLLGEIRAEQGKWQEMVDAFAACEKINPAWRRDIAATKEHYWRLNFNAGYQKLRNRDFEKSSELLEAATIIFPERPISQRLLGEASLANGDTTQALTAFDFATSLDPEDHISRRFIMSIQFSLGEFAQAIRQADVLLQVFENDIEALRIRAYSLDRLDNKLAATEAYTKLIEVSEESADVETYAAFKYRNGLYDDAIFLSRLAIERGGNREENLQAIAQSRLMQQNFPELLSAASELAAIAPENLTAVELKQFAQITLGQLRQALQTRLDYLHAMARIRLKQKKYPELLETTGEILTIRTNDLEALRLRADIFDSTGNYKSARQARLLYLDVLAKKDWEEKNFLAVIRTTAQTLALDSTNFSAAQMKQNAHDSLGQTREALDTQIAYHAAVARQHLRQRNFYAFLRKAMDILAIDSKNLMALKYKQMAHDSLGQRVQASQAEVAYLLALAEKEAAKNNHETVLPATDRILDLERRNRKAANLKVAAHESLRQPEQAKNTEIEYQLASIEALLDIGNGAEPLSVDLHYRKILAAVDTILALDAGHIRALEHRKNTLASMGRLAEAEKAGIAYLLAIARTNLAEKNDAELLETAGEILAIDPSHIRALSLKKDALARLDRTGEARNAEIAYLLAIADSLSANKNYRQLIVVSEQILALDHLNKPAVDFKQSAHRALNQNRQENETLLNYLFALATRRMQQKKYQEVHLLVGEILALDPTHIEALTLKRNAYLSTASLEEAMAVKKQIESLTSKKK
jgi:tetratricopeptide (TPR) repeat protein